MIRNILGSLLLFGGIGLVIGLLVEYWAWLYSYPLSWMLFFVFAALPFGVLVGILGFPVLAIERGEVEENDAL